ncbi:MAG: HXXEE domain-containing protein [Candidatus Bathyarchaeia archaeon]|jgi:hypothetical protein
MKVFRPVVIGVTVLAVVSFLFGLTLDALGITLTFSAMFYLFLCFAQVLHSLEEYFTQFWMHIAETPLLTMRTSSRDAKPIMDRVFIILFNIVLNMVMLSFYWPISFGASLSWLFGLGMAAVGVGNGFLHCGMAIRQGRYFSGCISAGLTLITGGLVFTSLSVRI